MGITAGCPLLHDVGHARLSGSRDLLTKPARGVTFCYWTADLPGAESAEI